MRAKEMLVLAASAAMFAGTATFADGPVAKVDGRTITPPTTDSFDQTVYPMACDPIYETFNDTYPPNYGTGWTVSDWTQIGCWGPAHKFVADGDYALCQILVSATHVTGTNSYRVRLHADDAGGSEPGSALGTWDFTGIPQNQAGPTPLLECDATGISLQNGVSYWLSFVTNGGNGDTWGVLRQSTLPGNERPSSTWKCSFWENRGTLNSGAWRITGDQGGGGVSMRLSGQCPGTITVAWANATPNKQMGILFANSTGSYTIPGGPCGGTTLGLSSSGLQLVNTIGTGSGSGQVNGRAGTAACRKFLQLVVRDGSPCTTSNVVQIP